jgi:hypothetical protein
VNPSGDIPDTQVYVPFQPASGGYSVKVPEGWARTEAGGVVMFTDKLNTVRLQTVPTPTAPTVTSARANEVPALKAAAANVTLGAVTTVIRPAGTAVLITYQADTPPDPVTGKFVRDAFERYEFWHNQTELIVTLSGPRGADNVDPWKTVTSSVTWQ